MNEITLVICDKCETITFGVAKAGDLCFCEEGHLVERVYVPLEGQPQAATFERWVVEREANGAKEYMQPLGGDMFGPMKSAIFWTRETAEQTLDDMGYPYGAKAAPVLITVQRIGGGE